MSMRSGAVMVVGFVVFCAVARADDRAEAYLPVAENAPSLEIDVSEFDTEVRELEGEEHWAMPLYRGADLVGNYLWEGHLYWGVEFMALDALNDSFSASKDSVSASRVSLGWERPTGFGIRGRYLGFDKYNWDARSNLGTSLTDTQADEPFELIHTNSNDVHNVDVYDAGAIEDRTLYVGRELDTLELDLYQRFVAGNSQVLVGTGLHSVRNLQQWQRQVNTILFSDVIYHVYDVADESLRGFGPTLVGELEYPLIARDTFRLALLMGGRTSYIPASYEIQSQLVDQSLNDELWINEAGAGLEVVKPYRRFSLILRGEYEVQYWNSRVTNDQTFRVASFSFGVGW